MLAAFVGRPIGIKLIGLSESPYKEPLEDIANHLPSTPNYLLISATLDMDYGNSVSTFKPVSNSCRCWLHVLNEKDTG